jgi:thiamine-monophosphate kinase
VDFLVKGNGRAKPEEIGRKALAVNLSDMAAMAGKPLAFVAAIGIPKDYSPHFMERVAKGILRLAREFDVAWVGGDISRAKELFISIALLGEAETKKLILRKGARRGDLIYVTGRLGASWSSGGRPLGHLAPRGWRGGSIQ